MSVCSPGTCPECDRARVCKVPPSGWSCSRPSGHEGPCAARPDVVETGWLIEQQYAGRGVWWRATSECGRDWTTDACEAVRFSRREDAERVLRGAGGHGGKLGAFWKGAVATDHMWCNRTEETP